MKELRPEDMDPRLRGDDKSKMWLVLLGVLILSACQQDPRGRCGFYGKCEDDFGLFGHGKDESTVHNVGTKDVWGNEVGE